MLRLLSHEELSKLKGIPGTKVSIWRREKAKKFPKRTSITSQRYGWAEDIIDAYIVALISGHSPEEATAIAERLRAEAGEQTTARFSRRNSA